MLWDGKLSEITNTNLTPKVIPVGVGVSADECPTAHGLSGKIE